MLVAEFLPQTREQRRDEVHVRFGRPEIFRRRILLCRFVVTGARADPISARQTGNSRLGANRLVTGFQVIGDGCNCFFYVYSAGMSVNEDGIS